ncbi:MAG: beta-propeller fold lactonase family protein [Edaphobacter sp.]
MSLTVGLGITACSRDFVLAYVYATTAKPLAAGSNNGGVSAFAVDYQTGALVPLADSPLTAGRNPITLVPTPDGKTLYVVNQDDSNVMQFSIGTDGKLYLKNTVNLTGSTPTAAAVDPAGKFLYVTFTYQLGPGGQQLYSPASPGPGGISIFPIDLNTGNLGTATTQPVGNNPVAIAISPNTTNSPAYVYVVDQEPIPHATVLGFAQNAGTGALTPTPGTVITTVAGKTVATGYGAGTTPSAIAADPSSRFVYVTDQATNQLYGNLIGSGGPLVPMANGPFNTGTLPVAVTVDPRGRFLYVANKSSATVGAYAIDQATGTPVGSFGSAATGVQTAPTCIAIEPALGRYLYTSNNLDNSIGALQLDSHTGGLKQVQNTPFPSSPLPTCVVAVANGSHPMQIVNP